MRRWQIAKLRAAGLDTYAPRTWQEAQVAMQAQVDAAMIARAHEVLPAIKLDVPISPPTSPALIKPRAGKPLRPCPYCGVEFKALHWHTPKCKMRPAA